MPCLEASRGALNLLDPVANPCIYPQLVQLDLPVFLATGG